MFSKMIEPTYILEIGTYTGYSALCLAEGLKKNGKLITIDINEELKARTQGFFDESEYGTLIDFRIGNALEIIPAVEEPLDLVFIDADKNNYVNYYQLCIDKLRPGGIIIADNVLWSGKVIEPNQKGDKDTPALKEFNDLVQKDPRVENILFPVRDGLMVVRKL